MAESSRSNRAAKLTQDSQIARCWRSSVPAVWARRRRLARINNATMLTANRRRAPPRGVPPDCGLAFGQVCVWSGQRGVGRVVRDMRSRGSQVDDARVMVRRSPNARRYRLLPIQRCLIDRAESDQRGAVEVSAGSICWPVGGLTDSFGPDLRAVTKRPGIPALFERVHYDSNSGAGRCSSRSPQPAPCPKASRPTTALPALPRYQVGRCADRDRRQGRLPGRVVRRRHRRRAPSGLPPALLEFSWRRAPGVTATRCVYRCRN
jgi:hypothetical protein